MTDRMTERFESTSATGSPASGVPDGASTDRNEPMGHSETVTRSAAVDKVTLGQEHSGSSSDVAKEHAGAVAQDAKESTKNVASTAASEAKDVAHEARTQIRQLFDQLSGEATDQASGQTQRAVQGLRSLSSELSGMAQGQQDQQGQSGQSGMAADLAQQGAARISSAADWLEGRQPGEILDEVRSFARRRPGAFLAGAAILGIIGGRMTRGLTGDSSSSEDHSSTAGFSSTTPSSTFGGQASPGYGQGAAYGQGAGYAETAGIDYGSGTPDMAYPADPVDLEGTDPSRVDAGIDPATYTHPGASTGDSGESR
jgi:hypothetical protein